jgi:hypothetical protein
MEISTGASHIVSKQHIEKYVYSSKNRSHHAISCFNINKDNDYRETFFLYIYLSHIRAGASRAIVPARVSFYSF